MGHMKTVITAKLKLNTTSEQFAHLRAMQLAYRDALNFVSQLCLCTRQDEYRSLCRMARITRSALVFICPPKWPAVFPARLVPPIKPVDQNKKNAEDRRVGRTKKRYKGLDQAPKYVSPTLTYQYKKDYSFRREQQVSI